MCVPCARDRLGHAGERKTARVAPAAKLPALQGERVGRTLIAHSESQDDRYAAGDTEADGIVRGLLSCLVFCLFEESFGAFGECRVAGGGYFLQGGYQLFGLGLFDVAPFEHVFGDAQD